jgi:hypothetical protein
LAGRPGSAACGVIYGQQLRLRSLPGLTRQSIVFAKTSGEERWSRGSIAPMAATNKCLAQSNKSRMEGEATNKWLRRQSGAVRMLIARCKNRAPSRAHHVEDSDHRDCAAADARHRAAIPATTPTDTARPMVPGGLDGERQLLRAGLRQRAGRYPEERLVSGRLARERQLLHPLRSASASILASSALSTEWRR